jgi:hypothetical protein
MNAINPIYLQILKARQDGLTDDQISEILGLTGGASDVKLIVDSNSNLASKTNVTVESLIKKYKVRAVQILAEIMEQEEDHPMVRVQAAKIILTGEGELPELGADKLRGIFEKMKKVSADYEQGNIIPIEAGEVVKIDKADNLAMAGAI